MKNSARFRGFIQDFTRLIDDVGEDEKKIFVSGKTLLQSLITHDDWLPEEFSKASTEQYQQFLLHCDPLERFSIASFVWGPGQLTPIHDHTVWGMVGIMRGGELCEEFSVDQASGQLVAAGQHTLNPGDVDLVSPTIGDIHRVSNALNDDISVSIHIYGANIGRVDRHTYEQDSQKVQSFTSGYTNPVLPNIWG
jgi:predicted metal-dependent enzyme (double-stranded beta helix superfamily)